MRRSYLDYAMSVIVGRALPDVRDGLKPVHRRILFAMHEANNVWNRSYVKCARVVGEVLGKYHPHGDSATYEALVRMAQDFSMRYTLIDGQGNFGSVDGDSAAAYRYTECRLEKITSEMLADIDMETVDFVPNYDGKEREPVTLPTRVPEPAGQRLLGHRGRHGDQHSAAQPVRGGGCLPGAAQEPRHQHRRVDRDRAGARFSDPRHYLRGGGRQGRVPHRSRGRVDHARPHQVERTGEERPRELVVIDELPYQVNKANLLMRIGELVREKKIEGISDIRDESDKSGMRAVIELKRGEVPDIILNRLWKETQMQDTFGMNMVALVDGQPRCSISSSSSTPSCAIAARWSRAAPCSSCAKPASAATSWKASPSRFRTSTK